MEYYRKNCISGIGRLHPGWYIASMAPPGSAMRSWMRKIEGQSLCGIYASAVGWTLKKENSMFLQAAGILTDAGALRVYI